MSSRPFVRLVAGPNGSGKTTLLERLRASGADVGEYVNPDAIALNLAGTYEERVREAQGIADMRREFLLATETSFTFESVMSHPSKVEFLGRAAAAGFHVHLVFVGTDDPDINVVRVAGRVVRGGHSVPIEKIKDRWSRAMDLLPSAMRASDEVDLFDNSSDGEDDGRASLVLTCRRKGIATLRVERARLPIWVQRYVIPALQAEGVLIEDAPDEAVVQRPAGR